MSQVGKKIYAHIEQSIKDQSEINSDDLKFLKNTMKKYDDRISNYNDWIGIRSSL